MIKILKGIYLISCLAVLSFESIIQPLKVLNVIFLKMKTQSQQNGTHARRALLREDEGGDEGSCDESCDDIF